MKVTPIAFPPHAFEVIEELATPEQQAILAPLYEAESQADAQGLVDLQAHLSGLIWKLNKEWKLIV